MIKKLLVFAQISQYQENHWEFVFLSSKPPFKKTKEEEEKQETEYPASISIGMQ